MLQLIKKKIKDSTNGVPDIIPDKSTIFSSLPQQMLLDDNNHMK